MQRVLDSDYDHIVVGGGAMGSATAWQLAKRGRSVLMIEAFTNNHVSGSSHGGTRIFRLGHQQRVYTELGISALRLWRELEAESDTSLVELIGHVDHGPAETINEIEQILTSHNLASTRMSPQAARDRWPGMIFDEQVVFSPDGGRVFAQRSVDTLWRRVRELSGDILFNTEVLSINLESEVAIVETQTQTFAHEVCNRCCRRVASTFSASACEHAAAHTKESATDTFCATLRIRQHRSMANLHSPRDECTT